MLLQAFRMVAVVHEEGQAKSFPGFRSSQLKGQKKQTHAPVSSLGLVGDFCLVQPSALHKTLEESQGLWILIWGAACRGDS